MNPTPERRKNLALRELVDQAYHLIEPFFDPSNAWNGQQLEHLAYRLVRENLPQLPPARNNQHNALPRPAVVS